MRNKGLTILFTMALMAGSVYLGLWIVASPSTGLTLLVGLVPALICLWVILRSNVDRKFLLRVFGLALGLRWMVALLIYNKHLQSFFGADAATFDSVGDTISKSWQGVMSPYLALYTSHSRPGWGMLYFVAGVYYTVGRDQLLIQLINCALGAGACIAVYKIAQIIYPNQRVARTAALITALSPSMILWSSQMLKDAPIVLSLCLCTLYSLKLRNRFNVKDLLLLLVFLFCLFTLRHYAFYIMFVAIACSFLFAVKRFTPLRLAQGGILIIVIGIALSYMGAANVPEETFDLKRIQASREWSAKEANSGFGGDVDISDPKAAIGFLPVGLMYVLFAPFPWMINNVRQLITLPELIAWWALVPMLLKGYGFVIRHRLKESFSICVFTVGLTLAYALYQSNVGTAYRHRAQLYVFFFIFIGIGLERRRAAKLKQQARFVFEPPGFAPLAPTPLSGSLSGTTIRPRTP